MNTPLLRPDGSCPACVGGWQCEYHQREGVRRFQERERMLAIVARGIRARRIADLCARYELESDEFQTREQKAEHILANGTRRTPCSII